MRIRNVALVCVLVPAVIACGVDDIGAPDSRTGVVTVTSCG